MNRYCPKLLLSCLDFESKLSNTLEPALCSYGSTECFSLWACTFIELIIYLFIYLFWWDMKIDLYKFWVILEKDYKI